MFSCGQLAHSMDLPLEAIVNILAFGLFSPRSNSNLLKIRLTVTILPQQIHRVLYIMYTVTDTCWLMEFPSLHIKMIGGLAYTVKLSLTKLWVAIKLYKMFGSTTIFF
jgi:hypothetical protein